MGTQARHLAQAETLEQLFCREQSFDVFLPFEDNYMFRNYVFSSADADSDGAHIATLLCALLLRHFRPLVAAGHVFVAMPPLYRIDAGKDVVYAQDEAEKERILAQIAADKIRGKVNIQRFKGLGEMNPSQLRETTMAPESRRLVQLTLDSELPAEQLLDMLLAKKRSSDRRDWLERKGNLAIVA